MVMGARLFGLDIGLAEVAGPISTISPSQHGFQTLAMVAKGTPGYLRRRFPLAGRAFKTRTLTGRRRFAWAEVDLTWLHSIARQHGLPGRRAHRGLTRRQLADLCGRSLSWVDKVEGGGHGLLRLPMLERVAEALHISVEILTGTTEARQAPHCLDLFEVSAIGAALQSYQAISRVFVPTGSGIVEPPDLDRLAQQVTYVWTAFQNANWPLLGQALPRLLTTAQMAVARAGLTNHG